MTYRAILGVAAAAWLVACAGDVTSLGSPAETKSPLAQETDDSGTSRSSSSGSSSGADASSPADGTRTDDPTCFWYSWMPVATTDQNQYLLPENAPTNDDPGFIPANWDLDWVRIELMADQSRMGWYKASAADCLDDDGWYFVDGVDGSTATRYGLCPKTSLSVPNPDEFRLAARSCP